MSLPLVIVKVGGSLLLWEELPRRLNDWLTSQPAGRYVLLAGSGPLGDFVRQADAALSLGQEQSHWLCVDALSITARLLGQIVPGAETLDSLTAVQSWRDDSAAAATCIFNPSPFLREEEASFPGSALPHTWDATTDSIAARVATCLDAPSLVLLKSCDSPAENIEEASRAGYVDRYFPVAAARLAHVACTNIRSGVQTILQGHKPDGV